MHICVGMHTKALIYIYYTYTFVAQRTLYYILYIYYYTIHIILYTITTLTLRRGAGQGVLLSSSGDEESGLIGGCGESV